jgi:hypothetical protein
MWCSFTEKQKSNKNISEHQKHVESIWSAETQLVPHTYNMSDVGQNFQFSDFEIVDKIYGPV